MTSKVEIISSALTLLGKAPVNSIGSGPPIVDAVSTMFDLVYPDLLTAHKWCFATSFKVLTPLVQTPQIDRWQYAYLLPSDLLHLYGTYPETLNYARYENYIYTNQYPTLTIEYAFLADINKWPIYFKNLMVVTLAAYAAMAVTENETLHQDYSQKALNYLISARSRDSQQQPAPVMKRDPIYSRKFGG